MIAQPWRGFGPSVQTAWQEFKSLARAFMDNRGRLPRRPKPAIELAPWQRAATWRRRMLIAWIIMSAWVGSSLFADALPENGSGILRSAQICLFGLLFGWVSAGFWTALMGFVVFMRGDPHALSRSAVRHHALEPDARTAIIMPICNEHVPTVFAGLRATCESLIVTGSGRAFDVFVLSDSYDTQIQAEELAAWQALRAELGEQLHVHYRLRKRRSKRKAGNVADFCRRWGKNYRYMVVLDADSIMSGDCLVTMAKLMEAHPSAGIIQTAPRACGHHTLHARAHQFAARVVGPLFTAGMQYWQLGESHYWGHNAIIRVKPFMDHCGLAPIAGKGGLSGDIMSHDFVEAALMRRAGYHVWLVDDLPGSYEQLPPNLLTELQRDRRWCQGNLQNAQLIAEPGLHAVHRAMLFTGAMAYASAPLWLLFILIGMASWLVTGEAPMGGNAGVFSKAAVGLWVWTAGMLLLPRLLGLLAVALRREERFYGGFLGLVYSASLELFLSVVQAPIRMVAHTIFVLAPLTGLRIDWKSPPREAADLAWADARRQFGPISLVVLACGAWAVATDLASALWLVPVIVPLLFAVPLLVLTGHVQLGRRAHARGMLLTPEEAWAPALLRRAKLYASRLETGSVDQLASD